MRSQIALLDQGMLVRHIIDENSPLYSQTPQSLREDDAIFALSVVSGSDGHLVWPYCYILSMISWISRSCKIVFLKIVVAP